MSLLFLFQGTAANMEVCEQIEEISHFISHFQDHSDSDDYSFFEYVYEDYINNDGNSDDHYQDSDHDDTPVHSSHQCCQHFVFFTSFQPAIINSVLEELNSEINYHSFELNSRYLDTLFQPPRV